MFTLMPPPPMYLCSQSKLENQYVYKPMKKVGIFPGLGVNTPKHTSYTIMILKPKKRKKTAWVLPFLGSERERERGNWRWLIYYTSWGTDGPLPQFIGIMYICTYYEWYMYISVTQQPYNIGNFSLFLIFFYCITANQHQSFLLAGGGRLVLLYARFLFYFIFFKYR